MLKPIATLAAVGFVGAFVFKFLFMLAMPLFAMVLGFFFLVLKIALIFGLIWAGYRLFCKLTDRPSEA